MRSLGGLLGSRHQPHGSSQSLNALEEPRQIEDAMQAASLILNDDVEGAEAALSHGNSPFHKMGKGVVVFLRATLGFEPEVMREASEQLYEAESSASEHYKKATRQHEPQKSSIYPAGTEYALCLAEAQLMGAVVGVLNESLTESIKGFYKLRKAYVTLDGILASENSYVRERNSHRLSGDAVNMSQSHGGSTNVSVSAKRIETVPNSADAPSLGNEKLINADGMTTSMPSATPSSRIEYAGSESDDTDEFFDAEEAHRNLPMPSEYDGHVSRQGGDPLGRDLIAPRPSSSRRDGLTRRSEQQLERSLEQMALGNGPDKQLFTDNPVDAFIHSGSNLCFGILQLIISLIPPAFATLLKIVGFRGDKDNGVAMLWQATKFHNVHGGIAGLVLFGFYNGLIGFCDIVPREGEGSYPKERCEVLLREMRKRYPQSQLWKLEEVRMIANEKQLEKSIEAASDSPASQLQQLEALQWFERSLNCMYLHSYEETSASFHKCVELNNWSHGLYYYISACAHFELYRSQPSNSDEARRQAKKATDLFHIVPQHAGRKRFMARQLPFDSFIVRKIQKWQQRAEEWQCEFIDAIGVSPIEEIIYFWNGYKRMRPEHLQKTLSNLAWSTSEMNPNWVREDLDEKAILALLKGATLRHLGKFEEARDCIQGEILSYDRALFKGHLKDSWTAPCARYEMAASIWMEIQSTGDYDREQLQEISNWLEEVAKWERYDLDARMGLRVTTGKDTIRRLGVQSTA